MGPDPDDVPEPKPEPTCDLTWQDEYSEVAKQKVRRYVWRMVALMIQNELDDETAGQWFFGGVTNERDRVLIRKAAKEAIRQAKRKAKAPW